MTRVDDAFGPFDGRIWLNTAQQGPLPRCAAEASRRAIELKRNPAKLSEDLFEEVPTRLRAALAAILGVSVEEVILGNSASSRSANVVLEHPRTSEAAAALRAAGIDVAIREGRMRISPHCHNTVEDIDRTVEALQGWLRKHQ